MLFADVVRSMDIAAAVGAERLREIMTELVNRAAVVVQRYGGTVGKFTGDGLMAVFGAPVALEDHAFGRVGRPWEFRRRPKRLPSRSTSATVSSCSCGWTNSGQVIAGEIGSGPFGYTAVGEQVGHGPADGVGGTGGWGDAQRVHRPAGRECRRARRHRAGADQGQGPPVRARRLLGWAMGTALPGVLSRILWAGNGRWPLSRLVGPRDRRPRCCGGVVGSPGIGKSRMVREVTTMAAGRGVEVFWTFCESHASEVPFHAVARLLRAASALTVLTGDAARERVREQFRTPTLRTCFCSMTCSASPTPNCLCPNRSGRASATVDSADECRVVGPQRTAVYVIEDTHWIDAVSESMLADFLTVIPQTPSLVLVTSAPNIAAR